MDASVALLAEGANCWATAKLTASSTDAKTLMLALRLIAHLTARLILSVVCRWFLLVGGYCRSLTLCFGVCIRESYLDCLLLIPLSCRHAHAQLSCIGQLRALNVCDARGSAGRDVVL